MELLLGFSYTHSRHEAVVQVFIRKKNSVFNEDSTCSQDEGEEQVYVDVVSGAVKLPAKQRKALASGTMLLKEVSICASHLG